MEVRAGYKQTEVGVIPEDWDVVQLGELQPFVTSGSRGWASFYSEHGSLFVRITNLSRDTIYLDLTDSKFVRLPPGANEGVRTQLREDDVLISITADIGIVGYIDARVPLPAYINQHIALVRFDSSKFSGKFVSYFLASEYPQKVFRASTDTGAKAGMSLGTVQKIQTALPSLTEQRAIAAALSDVDALLDALDGLTAKKRDLKQAAMQQLLTGQSRLPGFHGEWAVNTIAELEKHELLKLSRGRVISKKDIVNAPGEFPIYSSSIHNDGLFGRYGDFMFDEELITWSVDGGGNFFYRRKHKFSVTNVCGFMRVDTSRIDYRFFAEELQLLHSRKSFDYQSKAHPSVVRREYEVQLPPLPEQAAIAEILTDMDAELVALEARRAKTRDLKQAMMQELLAGNRRLVPTGGADA